MLAYVPASAIDNVWPEVEPWFAAIEIRTRGRRSAAETWQHLRTGAFQLWLWRVPEIRALALTEIIETPAGRVCVVPVATGRGRGDWLAQGLTAIEHWAAENGCIAVEPICRRGWEPELKALGYKVHHLEMTKELGHG